MNLPLYQEKDFQYPQAFDTSGNMGVWFERFANLYDANFQVPKGGDVEWLKQFNRTAGDSEAIERFVSRQLNLVEALQGYSQVFSSVWHFVTGMGNPHPVENGFAWHPVLGVPYLTGAAVKGIVRAYIENYLESDTDKKSLLLNWFGSTSKDPRDTDYESQTGKLIFFDAIPIKSVILNVDIMTPHMGQWYAKGGSDQDVNKPETLPADWHNPIPVPFLAAKDIRLLFSFAIRQHGKAAEESDIDLTEVADVLQRALTQFGAGAKTSTGYGIMTLDQASLERLQAEQRKKQQEQAEKAAKEKQLAQLSPIERELAELALHEAVIKLESYTGDDQKAAAQFIKERMQAENSWKEKSTAKKPEKDKDHQRTLQVRQYL